MKRLVLPMLVLALLLALAGTAFAQGGTKGLSEGAKATADLKDKDGKSHGTATLTQQAGGVRVQAQVNDLEPGQHGIHVHAVGKCDAPDFTTAGGHFNPTNKQHGAKNPQGAHAGDMPNLTIGANRSGAFDNLDTAITFVDGAPGNIFDADGSALVIHANPDDEMTDPSGNSGGRVLCGVIQLQQGATTAPLPTTGGHPLSGWLSLAALGVVLALGGLALRRQTVRA